MKRLEIKNKWHRLLVIFVVLLVVAKIFTLIEQDKVRAAVVLADLGSSKDTIQACYVAVDWDQDPSNALIRRLRNSGLKAFKASSDPDWPNWTVGAFLPDSPLSPVPAPRIGARLRLSSITWHGPFIAEMVCSYPGGGMRYRLIRGWRWSVVKKEMDWVS